MTGGRLGTFLGSANSSSTTNTFEANSDSQVNVTNGCITLDDRQEAFDKLKRLRAKNIRNPIIAYLNINSVRNKFAGFSELIADYVDVIILAETKLDSTSRRINFHSRVLRHRFV